METVFLPPIESGASSIIETIVGAARVRQVPELSSMERRAFVTYFYIQLVRLPSVRDKLVDEEREELTRQLATAAKVRLLDDCEHALLAGGDEKKKGT